MILYSKYYLVVCGLWSPFLRCPTHTFARSSFFFVLSLGFFGHHCSFAWNGLAPPRVQTFIWCALKGKVLIRMDLRRRGLIRTEEKLSCPLCGYLEEDVDYLFINCPFVTHLWLSFVNLFEVPWVFDRTCAGVVGSWFLSGLSSRWKIA